MARNPMTDHTSQMPIKTRGNEIPPYAICPACKAVLKSIESIRRSDGNKLQLMVCNKCHRKWKELWSYNAWNNIKQTYLG
jgi:rubredoxin